MFDANAVIAEATKNVANEQQASKPEAQPEKAQSTPETKPEDTGASARPLEEDLSKKLDSELTPEQLAKREKNRDSHKNSKLAELRRKNRELEARLAQPAEKPKAEQPKANEKPDAKTFKGNWEEFNEALLDWKLSQNQNKAAENKQQESPQIPQVDPAKALRANEIGQQEAEFVKTNPEYATLVNENQAFFQSLTPELADGFAGAENPTLALFALMKEGKLDDLFDMSPTALAREIAKAEIRGETYLKPATPVSNAPKPMTAAKGNAVGEKDLNSLSVPELMKKFK